MDPLFLERSAGGAGSGRGRRWKAEAEVLVVAGAAVLGEQVQVLLLVLQALEQARAARGARGRGAPGLRRVARLAELITHPEEVRHLLPRDQVRLGVAVAVQAPGHADGLDLVHDRLIR